MDSTAPAATSRQGDASRSRVSALDAVRGVALCMVLTYHYCSVERTWTGGGNALLMGLLALVHSNWLSLHLFFVLSGFLITGILIRARQTPHYYRNFYIRRVLRILPPYYLLLAFVFLIYPYFNEELRNSWTIHEWPWHLAHIQNLRVAVHGPFDWQGVGHFWSLAVEEQFYLLWPLLIAIVPLKRLPAFCAALFVFSGGLRLGLTLEGVNFNTVYVLTLTNLDGLAAGAWIAAITALHPQPPPGQVRNISIAGALGLAGLIALFFWDHGINVFTPYMLVMAVPLMAVASATMIYLIHHRRLGPRGEAFFNLPLLVWLGRYSYGIYLIHAIIMPQLFSAMYLSPNPWLLAHEHWRVVIFGLSDLLITIPSAWLMFRYIEAPAMNLAKRFNPEPRHQLPVAGN